MLFLVFWFLFSLSLSLSLFLTVRRATRQRALIIAAKERLRAARQRLSLEEERERELGAGWQGRSTSFFARCCRCFFSPLAFLESSPAPGSAFALGRWLIRGLADRSKGTERFAGASDSAINGGKSPALFFAASGQLGRRSDDASLFSLARAPALAASCALAPPPRPFEGQEDVLGPERVWRSWRNKGEEARELCDGKRIGTPTEGAKHLQAALRRPFSLSFFLSRRRFFLARKPQQQQQQPYEIQFPAAHLQSGC